MSVLDDILAAKRDEVTLLHQPQTRDAIRSAALNAGPTRGFEERLRTHARVDGRLGVIAEIKRRSPSKGNLAPDLDPGVLAKDYAAGGAACLSVLTDEAHFGGSAADLAAARGAVDLPVLRKDFTVSEADVCDARIMGADAVLLIVAALDDDELTAFRLLASELDLAALLEVHDEAELDRAMAAGADLVGVNQRDLRTFDVDRSRAASLATRIPDGVVKVAESGVRHRRDAADLLFHGYDAVLVGEALVTSGDPAAAVRTMRCS